MKNYDDKFEMAYYWLDENIGRVLLVVLFAGLGLWGLLLEGRDDLGLGQRLVRGMGPELAGIVIAAVTIDALAERRQRQSRKEQLIRQLGSKYRDVTELALLELKHEGWLYDGTLRGINLIGANLSGANLIDADLSDVNFWQADLSEAFLIGARLLKTNFTDTNLRNAILSNADLSETKLEFANLAQVNLEGANLFGAKLWRPNLGGTYLDGVNLSRAWIEEADLERVSLRFANLEETNFNWANLSKADLPGANLRGTKFHGSELAEAYLENTKNWTIEQLVQASTLRGAIMPDGVKLSLSTCNQQENIERPTFDEWKAQYLATHGGTETDLRDPQ